MIKEKQLTAMMINAIAVKMLMTFPRSLFENCGNSVWLAVILSTVAVYGMVWIIGRMYTSDKSLVGLSEQLGGKGLKIAVGTAVFIILSLNLVSVLRIFPEIIRLVLLQQTYTEVIGLAFLAVIVIGAACGIEAIARVHSFFIPIAAGAFGVFLLMLIPNLSISKLFPILGKGISSLFLKGSSAISVFNDILLMNILIPYTNLGVNYKKAGLRSVIFGGICCLLIVLFYGMIYVYPTSAELLIPVYQLERVINLGDFFSRLEALFQFIWSISILLYAIMYICTLSLLWKETFDLSHSKPLIVPITLLLASLAALPRSVNGMIEIERIIAKWNYIPSFLIILIIGIVSCETFMGKDKK